MPLISLSQLRGDELLSAEPLGLPCASRPAPAAARRGPWASTILTHASSVWVLHALGVEPVNKIRGVALTLRESKPIFHSSLRGDEETEDAHARATALLGL